MSVFAALVSQLARLLEPLFAASATAAAIVLFTLGVRLALHPLTRAAVRGEKARARLAPRVAELRRKHGRDPERLQRATADLYAREGTSPVAGCLPMLLQLPVFFVMYRLFSASEIGGRANELLGDRLFAAPLGGHWADALRDGGPLGAQGIVYAGLFALIAAVATWTYLRARRAMAAGVPGAAAAAESGIPAVPGMAGMAKALPLLSFGTLITAAVVPLAAGLYLVTTTTWAAAERAWLLRDRGRDVRPAGVGQSGSRRPAA
ncbi:YidC/Oxa1 family membrane protein insertase [Streptomyces sp. MNU89]|uniref:YidC/Oxa1 family membrane protein insertase n=1 Tax=Streptomyces sp. MNU89 TaxID=2560025 RepID=UPI001E300BD3|nr:YidC/Oxa1 family membrane protein insertase [Streptomyces sp. MNU89]MCC9741321.1 YidC/Oxa1 family membrane protein insertase [Streptomyces sp. MNU89]